MTQRILTLTYSNLDRTDGPVIHYMELWNSFVRQFGDEFEVSGLGCITHKRNPFLIKNLFCIDTVSSAYPRLLRLLIQDLYFAFRILRRRRDIVYLRTGNNMLFSVLAAEFFRVRLYTEYNGIAALDAGSNQKSSLFTRFVAAMERRAIRASQGCIGVSRGIENFLIKAGAKRAICINNGVSPEFYSVKRMDRTGKRVSIVYVGTFTPWDGAANIITLAEKFPEVDFHMVGNGSLRESVEGMVRSANVHFQGFVNYGDLKDEYAKHDAGIILYEVERNQMELSSLKTLEYIATGLPVFSTRVPGQEFIEDDGIGVLTDIGEVDRKFAEFLTRLPVLRARIDEYRNATGQRFSWDRAAKETRSFIEGN